MTEAEFGPGYFIIAALICYCFCLFARSGGLDKARLALQPATRGRRGASLLLGPRNAKKPIFG